MRISEGDEPGVEFYIHDGNEITLLPQKDELLFV